MNLIRICNKIIEYSFYALFFLVPLTFTDKTSELFEFNKMWVTFGFTIIIVSAWLIKMILQKRILLCRTPLDLPILLFLFSQFISTLFSLDMHTSIWGYYSRFNGGLLSILSYIFLYYAFLSNLSHLGKLLVKRILLVSLFSGLIVALWGLPSHFGYDPTCLIFRGNFDVSCWTDAFQPKLRIFSTLGQPNWMAAYLAILIPLSIAFSIQKTQNTQKISSIRKSDRSDTLKFRNSDYLTFRVFRVFWKEILYLLIVMLFYLDLLFTSSKSGYIGFIISIVFMIISILFINIKNKILGSKVYVLGSLGIFSLLFLLFAFLFGQPISAINKFSLPELLKSRTINKNVAQISKPPESKGPALEVGGTDSGKIRLIVWKGAIDIFKNNPLFGSGVETFAFAYYRYRPAAHNMTSEWDYLYNKAHNEYLNYIATTGIFGLGSYLAMIGMFLWLVLTKIANFSLKSQNLVSHLSQTFRDFRKNKDPEALQNLFLTIALLSSYLSILVSNFFGFSVVIVNLYMFMIPAFVLILLGMIKTEKNVITEPSHVIPAKAGIQNKNYIDSHFHGNDKRKYKNPIYNQVGLSQWIAISLISLFSLYLIFNLYRFWQADTDYALGSNYNKIGEYEIAHAKLTDAVQKRGSEPTFKDELSFNKAALSLVAINNKDATSAADLIKKAVELSDKNVTEHPNNIIFWKTRVRIFYTLSQFDSSYLQPALNSIIKAAEFAPTDAKISYNLGVLYGQTGNMNQAINVLKKTIQLKPDYRDAYYAMGLFYHEAAVDKDEKVIKPDMQEKAVETMKYILTNFSKDDKQAKEALEKWGVL